MFVALTLLRDEQMALPFAGARGVFASREQQLDRHIVRRQTIERNGDFDVDLRAEAEPGRRPIDARDSYAGPCLFDFRLPRRDVLRARITALCVAPALSRRRL